MIFRKLIGQGQHTIGGLVEGYAYAEEVIVAYHERTKHHFLRSAAALGYMDWATQPDPFRRYEGVDLLVLILPDFPVPFLTESKSLTMHGSDVLWQGKANTLSPKHGPAQPGRALRKWIGYYAGHYHSVPLVWSRSTARRLYSQKTFATTCAD